MGEKWGNGEKKSANIVLEDDYFIECVNTSMSPCFGSLWISFYYIVSSLQGVELWW